MPPQQQDVGEVTREGVKLDRKSVDFPMLLSEVLKDIKYDPDNQLQYFQQLGVAYFSLDINSKGFMFDFEMGLGKSLSSIAVAHVLRGKYKPIVLSTKSITTNYKLEIEKYEQMTNEKIMDEFNFVAYNSPNMLSQLQNIVNTAGESNIDKASNMLQDKIVDNRLKDVAELKDLNGYLLIVDEAHNFFRRIINGSEAAIELYDLIMASPNVKLLFLTGTPIPGDPFALVPAINMLAGEVVLPEKYEDFYKYFVDPVSHTIKNKEKFQNRIMGLVSHAERPPNVEGYAEMLETKVESVPMDSYQYGLYLQARDKEKAESSFGGKKAQARLLIKPRGAQSSSYRVRSRQISNYAPPPRWNYKLPERPQLDELKPEEVGSPKLDAMYKNIMEVGNVGIVYSQFIGIGGAEIVGKYLQKKGWKLFSLKNVMNISGKHAVPEDIHHNKSPEKTDKKPHHTLRFAFITGNETQEEGDAVLNTFKSPDNMHGEIIALLIISSKAAEGINTKYVRHIHMLEPYFLPFRFQQLIYRGLRFKSHEALPPNERNIRAYVYLSTHAKDASAIQRKEATTDEELWRISQETSITNKSFYEAMIGSCLECSIFFKSNCKICKPTGAKLYSNNIESDIQGNDPCQPYEVKKVEAELVLYGGKEYYYIKDKSNPFGYKVFIYNKQFNNYTELKENSPDFLNIIKAIKNAPKKSNKDNDKDSNKENDKDKHVKGRGVKGGANSCDTCISCNKRNSNGNTCQDSDLIKVKMSHVMSILDYLDALMISYNISKDMHSMINRDFLSIGNETLDDYKSVDAFLNDYTGTNNVILLVNNPDRLQHNDIFELVKRLKPKYILSLSNDNSLFTSWISSKANIVQSTYLNIKIGKYYNMHEIKYDTYLCCEKKKQGDRIILLSNAENSSTIENSNELPSSPKDIYYVCKC
jgi:hypothetical protein